MAGSDSTSADDFLPDEGLPSREDITALFRTAIAAPILAVFTGVTAFFLAIKQSVEEVASDIVEVLVATGSAALDPAPVTAAFDAPNVAGAGVIAFAVGILVVAASMYVLSWGVTWIVE